MFKRRNPKTYWTALVELVYPKKGWRRALNYIGLRIKRLPDTPHKIALGFSCGALVCFTPFFGLHFFMAAFLAFVVRGNVLASLIGTFFGNPLTFPIIGAVSYRLGLSLMGIQSESETAWHIVRRGFTTAFETVWINIKAIFGGPYIGWQGFWDFIYTVFFPYLIGGILPGILTALVIYLTLRPLVAAYQKRRKGVLMAKIKDRLAKKKSDTDGA